MQLIYPAVLTPEETGGFSVYFPDLKGYYTEGDDWQEAYNNSQEAMELYLETILEDSESIPVLTAIEAVNHKPQEFVTLVSENIIPGKGNKNM